MPEPWTCTECKRDLEPDEEVVQVRSGHLNLAGDELDFEPDEDIGYIHGPCYDASRPLEEPPLKGTTKAGGS